MLISEQWLREWVNPPLNSQSLAEQLTMAGLEVDGITAAGADLTKVVVGEVTQVEPHPDADRLRVCQVNVGAPERLNIVCGAPNVAAGVKVPTALIGARLPNGLKIKKSKLRGVPSQGMLCSSTELGLGEDASGLLHLTESAIPGTPISQQLGLNDQIIEIDLTPNRGDCLSIRGVAREVAALNDLAISAPIFGPSDPVNEERYRVKVEATAACPRYLTRVIRGVDPAATAPQWLRERLRRCGIRSISAVVDVTNYVLLELGQPMHAFDLDQLSGAVTVRLAKAEEQIELLNGSRATLAPDMLLIADEQKPLALAGIMGGAASGVKTETTSLLLESAFFTPSAIIGRARRLGLHTDSSHRFERGVDPELQRMAMERATGLLLEIAGGQPGPINEITTASELPRRAPVRFRPERTRQLLGVDTSDASIKGIFERLGLAVVDSDQTKWTITPPSHRFDIALEVDLIEEIGRIVGYNNIPETMPQGSLELRPAPERHLSINQICEHLANRGYQEVISYSFVDAALERKISPELQPKALVNPLSGDLSVLRTTLWSSLLPLMLHNQNRQQSRIRLFETGLCFLPGETLAQIPVLAGAVSGPSLPEQWGRDRDTAEFFEIKGDLEALIRNTGQMERFSFQSAAHPALHPGKSARIHFDDQPVGWLGEIHPGLKEDLDLRDSVILFQLEQAPLQSRRLPAFSEVSRFPSIRRDIALLVPATLAVGTLMTRVRQVAGAELDDLVLFDCYRGEGVPSGQKSIALGLTWNDSSSNLTDSKVEILLNQTISALTSEFGATLRD
ncbi:MAG: phenylalanine--tRNA ligase subunit beta [Gammaproteobacteria bacterium]|nr:phenylalanine--tRNA ligase subunit beta [Gammaproteobacteria bacterium]